MLPTKTGYLINRIEMQNRVHAIKIRKYLSQQSDQFFDLAENFFLRFESFLTNQSESLDFAVEAYCSMISDMIAQRVHFLRSGKYSANSSQIVQVETEKNPSLAKSYMYGLAIAQFFWTDQYERFSFFSENIGLLKADTRSVLEIGASHSLYSQGLLSNISPLRFDIVDSNLLSINFSLGMIERSVPSYLHKDFLQFTSNCRYDFIIAAEVIEHCDDPIQALLRIKELSATEGLVFFSTPANAPMYDHVFLFRNQQDIENCISKSGFTVIKSKICYMDNVSKEKAEQDLSPMMYAAFLKVKS